MPKSKSYKELLTPAYHRRFVNASGIALTFCWLEAILISGDSVTWKLIPFSNTGISIVLLFSSCLCIFIIRLSNLHFGALTTTSGAHTFYQYLATRQAFTALFWYFASSVFFGAAYTWSRGSESNLGWIDPGRTYERPRVNEQAILLRAFLAGLAFVQTIRHLYGGLDRVHLTDSQKTTPSTTNPNAMIAEHAAKAAPILRNAFDSTVGSLLFNLAVYYGFLRRPLWSLLHPVVTTFGSGIAENTRPSGLISLSGIAWHCISSMFLLSCLWGFSNAVFTYFMSQPPLRKSQPLTSDMTTNNGVLVSRAVDANGSLINGLLRKKETLRTFALWELYLICSQFEVRRKSIFQEVDREGGSSWLQISRQCLAEIDSIGIRIQQYNKSLSEINAAPQAAPQAEPTGLPKIASAQAKQGDILLKPRADLAQSITNAARAAGSHPGAVDPLSPLAKRAVNWGASQLISKEQQQQLSITNVEKQASSYAVQFLQTVPGIPFRDTFARTAKAVVFGMPYSAQTNIIHAARCLAALLKSSLLEDTCGIVAKDVPLVIRSLMAAVSDSKKFLETLQPSWTDVEFQPTHRQVIEILAVVGEIQTALGAILLAFGEYAPSLGMSKMEIRQAKDLTGMRCGQEMTQVLR